MYRLAFAALYGLVYEQNTVGTSNLTSAIYCADTDTMNFLAIDAAHAYVAFALAAATPPAPWDIRVAQNASAASLTLKPGTVAAPRRVALHAALDCCCPRLP